MSWYRDCVRQIYVNSRRDHNYQERTIYSSGIYIWTKVHTSTNVIFRSTLPETPDGVAETQLQMRRGKTYAEELILACRQKGLGAIAITDHHDFAFFPYIKKAAKDELDASGRPVPDEKKLVVFPGIELTLTAPNCQAILILDAEFPENLLQSVLTALAINPAATTACKARNDTTYPAERNQ